MVRRPPPTLIQISNTMTALGLSDHHATCARSYSLSRVVCTDALAAIFVPGLGYNLTCR
jgi:hypothetical protein